MHYVDECPHNDRVCVRVLSTMISSILLHLANAGETETEASEASDESKYHFTALYKFLSALCRLLTAASGR